ncbi:MAG: dihydropteroate synthase [Bacteroidetes bacterium]|nr:dihydropteroate synthase [Bacteroidota bacterium]
MVPAGISKFAVQPVESLLNRKLLINAGGRLIDLSEPRIMGVINITPDSFYSGSRYSGGTGALKAAEGFLAEGADIIDIGGCSTRPGSPLLSTSEERDRVIPVFKQVRREFPEAVLSIDTFRAEIAREARYEAGADIVNDVSGGTLDEGMAGVISELKVPYIMMHMRGTPATMQGLSEYDDVVTDVIQWFGKRIPALFRAGVSDIIIDPGIGFAKSISQNFEILRRLREFHILGLPLLAGVSRKSMIWRTLDSDPGKALNGTTALNMAALMNGADILRVHDVKEARETVILFQKLKAGHR